MIQGNLLPKAMIFTFLSLTLITGLYAQTEFPGGDYWSLDAGFGMTKILMEGQSYQFILDPKLWLSPMLMAGSKTGVSYSTDKILTFEGQAYLRWNFLRFGRPEKTVNIFAQTGIGLLASYRGTPTPFSDVTMTRGSLLFDAAVGVTIPLTSRWHIEPTVRGGYPHIAGLGLTAGYKFPLPQKIKYQQLPSVVEHKTERIEIIRALPSTAIIKRIVITAVEYILFGPDIGKYNVGIGHDAEAFNEIVLNNIAKTLKENPNFQVRIEGHANPVTTNPDEAHRLLTLSRLRAHEVAAHLMAKGVNEEQMIIITSGGTRTVTSEHDIMYRNRRVELIVLQIITD